MTEFSEMGGYAGTVWPAYGAAAVILIGLVVVSLRQNARRQQTLERFESEIERPHRT